MHNKLKKHIETVIPITKDEFSFIMAHFTIKNFKKGDFLIEKGNRNVDAYFIISGLLKLSYDDEQGKEHIVSFAMEDWWESDFSAFYSQAPATMHLQCLENTMVYSLTYTNYQKLCAEQPKMEQFFLKKSSNGHIASQQRILSFLSNTAKERYNELLKKQPTLLQRVPKTLLASYLGVSRETLSRLNT